MGYCYNKIMAIFVGIITPMRIFTESRRTFVFHGNVLLSDIGKMIKHLCKRTKTCNVRSDEKVKVVNMDQLCTFLLAIILGKKRYRQF